MDINRLLIRYLLDDESDTYLIEKMDLLGRLVAGKRTSEMAKDAGVSPQAASADLRGDKACPKFRQYVKKKIGDIRWWRE